MLAAAQNLNLLVRFLLELALLGVVAAAAWRGLRPSAARLAAVVLLPAMVAVGWVVLVHGDSMPPPVRTTAQIAALAVGIVALQRLGLRALTISAIAGLAVANAVLLVVWNQ
jgi:hypothetical protein